MPTPTPVLGLKAAVATDLEPTYLTADLAASLTTIDGLFNTNVGTVAMLPLAEPLTFSPDNTHDIGDALNTARPRDLYVGGTISAGGQIKTGNAAIRAHQGGGDLETVGAMVAGNGYLFVGTEKDVMWHREGPNDVKLVGHIQTTDITANGTIGIGGPKQPEYGLRIRNYGVNGLLGAAPHGLWVQPEFPLTAIDPVVIRAGHQSVAAAAINTAYVFQADSPALGGSGVTIGTSVGVQVASQGGIGVVNAYGVRIAAQVGGSAINVGLRNEGSTELASFLDQAQLVTPTTFPAAGTMRLYPKADGEFYKMDSAGVETPVGGAGGGGPITPPLDVAGTVRSSGGVITGLAGPGIELQWQGAKGTLLAYDRTLDTYPDLEIDGQNIRLVATDNLGNFYVAMLDSGGGFTIQDNLGYRILPATGAQYLNFGASADLAQALASTWVVRRNYDNIPALTLDGSGGLTIGVLYPSTVQMSDSGLISWIDANTRIYGDTARTMYFDTFNGSFVFRNSATAFTTQFSIDAAGSIVAPANASFGGACSAYSLTTAAAVSAGGRVSGSDIHSATALYLANGAAGFSFDGVYINTAQGVGTSTNFTAGGFVSAYGALAAGYLHSVQAPNNADNRGWMLANRFDTYTCVDHALEFGLRREPVTGALATVQAVQGYSYDHANFGSSLTEPERDADGQIVSAPTYGFSASEVNPYLPELVALDPSGVPAAIGMDRMLVILWEAFKEYVTQTEARLVALEALP